MKEKRLRANQIQSGNTRANQIQSGNTFYGAHVCRACADQIQAGDVVGENTFGGSRECDYAFHEWSAIGIFLADLHDKGQAHPPPATGQQTDSRRPVDFL